MRHGQKVVGIRWAMVAMAVVVGFVGGCASKQVHEYQFDIAPTTGMLAVDVQNFRGSVEIRADRKDDQATVVGVVQAASSMGDASASALAGVWVKADLVEESARGVLRVRTGSDLADTGDHWVDLVIHLPRCQGVSVENRGGGVLVVGTTGGTTITNREGYVEFRTDQTMIDPVTLTTVDGSIFYQVPLGSTGQFDLETLEGKVWYRDRVSSTDRIYSAPRQYQSRLAEGTNPVIARTNRGDISVYVDEDPVGLTRVFKSTLPDPQDIWFKQGSQRFTRNLPDDHPETQVRVRPDAYFMSGY